MQHIGNGSQNLPYPAYRVQDSKSRAETFIVLGPKQQEDALFTERLKTGVSFNKQVETIRYIADKKVYELRPNADDRKVAGPADTYIQNNVIVVVFPRDSVGHGALNKAINAASKKSPPAADTFEVIEIVPEPATLLFSNIKI